MSAAIPSGRATDRQDLIDLLLAIGLGTLAVLVTARFGQGWDPRNRAFDIWALILMVMAFGSLAVRRRWPLVTLGVSTLATTGYLLMGYPYGPILIAFFIAVYTVASRLPLRVAAIAVGLSLVVLLTHVFVHPVALGGGVGLIPGSAWAVVPFAIGTTVRVSRQAREAERADAMRQRLYEERLRIAQEVHDIVGHGLAAIQMQADVALHVDEHQSVGTRQALQSISRASSEAFEELRSTLEVINGSRGTASRAAISPSIDDLEDLCDRIRSTGVDVTLTILGGDRRLPGTVELTVYRVVQEALTNVIRHGAQPTVGVAVTIAEATVDVRVTNPGEVVAPLAEGIGISGMRRRVESVGGRFAAAPTHDGFEVSALIPFEDAP